MTDGPTMPGDRIAAGEEYMPGPGTYERDGAIFAAVMGAVRFDDAEKTVSVLEIKRISQLRPGDVVLGEVGNVTNSLATVAVFGLDETGRSFGAGENGAIHVAKISEGYTDDARKEFRIGDLVRARVVQVTPSLQLSTKEEKFGVLKARCGRCRGLLSGKSGKLWCEDCEKHEHRKLACDFMVFTPEARD
jgi:exosome complex component CSL4